MEIGGELQEVFVHVDQNGLVVALKEMPDALLPAIYITGITERKVLEEAGQRNFIDLSDEMDVLCEAPTYVKFPFPLL
jgi:hypothetical protein